jgi:hypothetical protein
MIFQMILHPLIATYNMKHQQVSDTKHNFKCEVLMLHRTYILQNSSHLIPAMFYPTYSYD